MDFTALTLGGAVKVVLLPDLLETNIDFLTAQFQISNYQFPCPTFLAPSTRIKTNKNSKEMKFFTYVRRAYFHHTKGENLTLKQKNKQNKFLWRKKIK